MFAQILFVFVAIWLFYIGIVEGAIFDIIMACFLIFSSACMFGAAKSGSSLLQEWSKWLTKKNNSISQGRR